MHTSQANRARIAERAATRPSRPTNHGTRGTNVALRVNPATPLRSQDGGIRKGKRSKGRGPGAVATDSRGVRNAWTYSPYAPKGGWR